MNSLVMITNYVCQLVKFHHLEVLSPIHKLKLCFLCIHIHQLSVQQTLHICNVRSKSRLLTRANAH